jgi:cytochrome b involved in lipid metabolism
MTSKPDDKVKNENVQYQINICQVQSVFDVMERKSTISHKFPSFHNEPIKSPECWIEGRRLDDGAEGLWRVHDKLYDLSGFVKNHPGGSMWLEMTKGIDITEQFEAHHITDLAEKTLVKFFVRDAKEPRNYKITFHENGFYKTVKRRVAAKLKDLDKSELYKSKLYCDLFLVGTVVLSILAAAKNSFFIALIASIFLSFMLNIVHNFIHQRDNWRMYLSNLTMTSFRTWRLTHAISHHHYPNSYHDIETVALEPNLNWFPETKTKGQILKSWLATPLIFVLSFNGSFDVR